MICPASGPPLISADEAARMLCDYFLVNADRGDNTANDELVAELVRRMRAERAPSVGASPQTTAETAAESHRARRVQ